MAAKLGNASALLLMFFLQKSLNQSATEVLSKGNQSAEDMHFQHSGTDAQQRYKRIKYVISLAYFSQRR